MIASDVFVITGALVLLCLAHWRAGVVATLLFGFALDPMRKLVAGEPLYFSVLVFALVGATLVGARMRGVPLSLKPVFARGSVLRVPLILFLLLVVMQSLAAFVRTGSPAIAAIGLVAYLAPIPGVLLGFAYARSTRDLRKLVRWYVVAVTIMAAGIYLARAGYDWKLLDAVGVGLVAYSPTGQPLSLASGFFRAPEVAAWHLAMATCFLLMLFLSRRKVVAHIWPTAALGLYLLVALMFTGRRKGLVEIALFAIAYLLCLTYFRKKALKTALILGALCVAAIGILAVIDGGDALGISPYSARGASVGMAEVERYRDFATQALWYTIQRNGWLGSGAGTGSQGAQFFGGGQRLVGSAAEGGLGKVVAELGVPGLVILLVLGVALGRYLWGVARMASRRGYRRAHYAYSLIAFLFANAVMYAVAHQIFGDPLVLYMIGFVLGMAFAVPIMGEGTASRPRERPPAEATPVGLRR
ncbi:MAG: O-antigen ligase family protein [Gemmatimonadota bacterium]